jgi:hypothetical protein
MPSHKNGKPIYWPQDAVRRGAMALRERTSNDIFRLARAVLEAAIRSESDLTGLLRPDVADRVLSNTLRTANPGRTRKSEILLTSARCC